MNPNAPKSAKAFKMIRATGRIFIHDAADEPLIAALDKLRRFENDTVGRNFELSEPEFQALKEAITDNSRAIVLP
mgnify:CR=1 FL=1